MTIGAVLTYVSGQLSGQLSPSFRDFRTFTGPLAPGSTVPSGPEIYFYRHRIKERPQTGSGASIQKRIDYTLNLRIRNADTAQNAGNPATFETLLETVFQKLAAVAKTLPIQLTDNAFTPAIVSNLLMLGLDFDADVTMPRTSADQQFLVFSAFVNVGVTELQWR